MSQTNISQPTAVVGANVRAEAARRRVSQRDFGTALGISHASVSARLSGRTPIDVNELTLIAKLLNVPLSTLLLGVESDAIGAAS